MRQSNVTLAALLAFGSIACGDRPKADAGAPPAPVWTWAETDLQDGRCRNAIEPNDPNDTPIQLCAGIAGYALVVRPVASGRVSVDVISPANDTSALALPDIVTRQMFGLDGMVEWRLVSDTGEAPHPIALVLRLLEHRDEARPELVTETFVAVAKINSAGACITARNVSPQLDSGTLQRAVDSAPSMPCVATLPP